MELWVSVAKGEYDGDLGSDTQQSGEERALGKGLRAVIEKSRWSDSNRRPLAYKARAITLSYIGTRTVYHRWSRYAEGWMAARNKGSRLESLDRFLFKSVSLSSCSTMEHELPRKMRISSYIQANILSLRGCWL